MNIALHAWKQFSYKITLKEISDNIQDFISNLLQYLLDTVEHLILAFILYMVICITLYFSITKWRFLTFNRESWNSKRVLFVIAHPDDECMFFGPTILNYVRKKDCIVYLMCLTTGRNYGMGSIRKNELYKSCEVLGIKESNIFIHSHTNLPDAMDVRWPTELVSKLVSIHVDSLNITSLITFDRYGVSYHANHTSIYYAVANLIIERRLPKWSFESKITFGYKTITATFYVITTAIGTHWKNNFYRLGNFKNPLYVSIVIGCGVYVLESVNLLRKYWLLMDIPLSLILSRFRCMGGHQDRKLLRKSMSVHKSQLVWFRRLYMYFSRYTLINTLQQMNLVDVELDLEIDE